MSDPSLVTRPADRLRAWASVRAQLAAERTRSIADLFATEPGRVDRLTVEACGLRVDLSKTRLSDPALDAMLALADEAGLPAWRDAMFAGAVVNGTEGRPALHVALRDSGGDAAARAAAAGEAGLPAWRDAMFAGAVVNGTEGRPALHVALRDSGGDSAARAAVTAERERVLAFAERLRAGDRRGAGGAPISDVVNIGIGGSDLGPRMVCRALAASDPWAERVHFVANLDSTELASTLEGLDPQRTLIVVTSKTFTTRETLVNAGSARAWLAAALGDEGAAAQLAAVTARPERAVEFGVDADSVFRIWDWVGGRYSLWSAVGLPIAVALGRRGFDALLAGARLMDRHFVTAEPARNLPVLLALEGIWTQLLLGSQSRVVLPYDHALRDLPAFLQQLEMESNGKRVTRDGEPLGYPSAPILWGGPGNNAQHAFFQLLHQGTVPVPCDFLVALDAQRPLPGHQRELVANALAQAEALLAGRGHDEARDELVGRGHDPGEAERLAAHLVLPGGRPSTFLIYERLDAATLGALLALHEHRVFVESVCWGVNPFDQWGVEVGKRLAGAIVEELGGARPGREHDPSTAALIEEVLARLGPDREEQGG